MGWLTRIWNDSVWSKVIAALIVAGFVAAVRWYRHRQTSAPVLQDEPPAPAPAPVVKLEPAADVHWKDDLAALYREFKRLSGRFAEREEFSRSLPGQFVRWKGTVSNVKTYPEDVTLTISQGPLEFASIEYPLDFKLRIYALQQSDTVEITGRIRTVNGVTAVVTGETLKVLVP